MEDDGSHSLATCCKECIATSSRAAQSVKAKMTPGGRLVGDQVSFAVAIPAAIPGRPSGPPVDFVTGFQADGKTMRRPVGVTVDARGAVIVADDLPAAKPVGRPVGPGLL